MYSSDQARSHVGRLGPVHGAAQPPAQESVDIVQYIIRDTSNVMQWIEYLYIYSYLFTAAPHVAVKTVLHCTVVQ